MTQEYKTLSVDPHSIEVIFLLARKVKKQNDSITNWLKIDEIKIKQRNTKLPATPSKPCWSPFHRVGVFSHAKLRRS